MTSTRKAPSPIPPARHRAAAPPPGFSGAIHGFPPPSKPASPTGGILNPPAPARTGASAWPGDASEPPRSAQEHPASCQPAFPPHGYGK
jgi:hypothetical protein